VASLALAAVANLKPDIPLETLKHRHGQPPSKFIQLGGLSVHYRDEGRFIERFAAKPGLERFDLMGKPTQRHFCSKTP
jgi:hypothetical protein